MPWIESTALGAAPPLKSPRTPPENRPEDKRPAEPGTWTRPLLLGCEATAGMEGSEAKVSMAQWSQGLTCDTRELKFMQGLFFPFK